MSEEERAVDRKCMDTNEALEETSVEQTEHRLAEYYELVARFPRAPRGPARLAILS